MLEIDHALKSLHRLCHVAWHIIAPRVPHLNPTAQLAKVEEALADQLAAHAHQEVHRAIGEAQFRGVSAAAGLEALLQAHAANRIKAILKVIADRQRLLGDGIQRRELRSVG
eukprot:5405247-Prymnesium_polylepis.1